MTKNLKKIFIGALLAVFLIVIGGVSLNYWMAKKMDKVVLGLASPIFPYPDYTEEELADMYPQIKNADVATRVTPEETYAKFRQALKDNNLEMAIDQLSKDSGSYKENKDALTNFFDKKKFKELFLHYPEIINRASIDESIAQYDYEYYSEEYKKKLISSISFLKDSNGDWKIGSL